MLSVPLPLRMSVGAAPIANDVATFTLAVPLTSIVPVPVVTASVGMVAAVPLVGLNRAVAPALIVNDLRNCTPETSRPHR